MGTILLLSGPNLNLFGQRDSLVYGTDTLDDMVGDARAAASKAGYDLEHVQSNHEGDLVDAIHDARAAAEAAGHTLEHVQSNHEGDIVDAIHGARDRCAAIVINPGAFGHYARAIHDALAAFDGPIIELHISNPESREPWRRTSVIAPVATGIIQGFGGYGYRLAAEAIAELLSR